MSEILRRIGDLDPKANYIARVRAFNRLGVASDWSDAIAFSTSDPNIDGSIPVVYAIAGARMILVQWDASIKLAHDHYEIYIGTNSGFTPNEDNLVASPKVGTIASITKYWNGTALVDLLVNQTYYIKMFDIDQSGNRASMGTEVNATTGISINENGIQSSLIVADRIATGNLLAEVTVSGIIKTGETGSRMEMDSEGLRGYAIDGITKNLEYKNVDGSVFFAGTISSSTMLGGNVISNDSANSLVSGNYSPGVSGWAITGDGNVDFNSGTFRGNISGATIDIGGADDSSFHVDSNGNLWLGDSTFFNAPFKISSTGNLSVSGGTITGGTINGGTITGGTVTGAQIFVKDTLGRIRTKVGLMSNGNYGLEVIDVTGASIYMDDYVFGSVFDNAPDAGDTTIAGTTYADFTDSRPSVTVKVGPTGKVWLQGGGNLYVDKLSGVGSYAGYIAYRASGANTIGSTSISQLTGYNQIAGVGVIECGVTGARLIGGLTPGDTTFTLQTKKLGADEGFLTNRWIFVQPL